MNKSAIPNADTLLSDLKERGGYHAPWYEVEGALIGSVLRAALKRGVQITEDGGLILVEATRAPTVTQHTASGTKIETVHSYSEGKEE